jgi:hypothetical protein
MTICARLYRRIMILFGFEKIRKQVFQIMMELRIENEKLLTHRRLKMKQRLNIITYKQGSEGPRHDPYHYEEVTIHGRAGEVTAHFGLGSWIRHNGERRMGPDVYVDVEFMKLTGIHPDVAFRLYRTLPYRRHARVCCGRSFSAQPGYPGETLYVCDKCEEIVDSHFNLSVVE